MRILKFRVWTGEDMVSPDYLDRNGCAHWSENSIPCIKRDDVMQFTGLVDKNGVEIYEGDIVVFFKGYVDDTWTDSEQGMSYVIEWDSESLSFKAKRGNKKLTPLWGQTGKHKWTWEVISNIYQNPELLNN